METTEKEGNPTAGLRDSTQSGSSPAAGAGTATGTVPAGSPSAAAGPRQWRRFRPFLLFSSALFVVLLGVAVALLPSVPSDRGSGLTIDAQGRVLAVEPDSTAWEMGVRPGWVFVAQGDGVSIFSDGGPSRPVPNSSSGPAAQGSQRVIPPLAVLASGFLLLLAGMRRGATALAITGAALCDPILLERLGFAGALATLLPVALALAFAWGAMRSVPVQARLPQASVGSVAAFAAVLAAASLAVYSAAVWLAGWPIIEASVVGLLVIAWGLILRGRVTMAQAAFPAPSRLAVARALTSDMVPFADRIRRRGAQAERHRLASEMHAELLPQIASAASDLERRGALDEAERVRQLAASVRDLVSERRLPLLEDEGLVAAAEWLAESLQRHAPITVELNLDRDSGKRLTADVESAAYRILQLALDNVVNHAGASTAWVEIARQPNALTLAVGDDGRGIDGAKAARAKRHGHLGLADMRAEAEAVGASLQIGRRSPEGTIVTMRWPA